MRNSILIVDDEPMIMAALRTRLAAVGYEVLQAVDGRSALEAAELHRPHAVLLDVRLPDMDGFEVCEQILQRPGLENTPIIFLTAHGQASFRQRAMEAGASAFFVKPYKAAEILAAVDRFTTEALPAPREGVHDA